MSIGRQAVHLVAIDIDFCQNVFGGANRATPVGTCTATAATGSECYNQFKDCQDTPNYDRGTKSVLFSHNQYVGLTGSVVFPALVSVSTSPSEIATRPGNRVQGPLGKRDRVTVTLADFVWGDGDGLDPYRSTRTYDTTQGTFFGKWRARNPYYYGRALRVYNGYVGENLANMEVENYIITEFKGPNANGRVVITAQDPLVLTGTEGATWPDLAEDELTANITATNTAIGALTTDFTPAGYARVGDEIFTYTGKTSLSFTGVSRGVLGTVAASHSTGTPVKQVLYLNETGKPENPLYDILKDGAGIDSNFLPKTEWETVFDNDFNSNVATLRRLFFNAMPIPQLLGEFANMGVLLWWDKTAQKVRVQISKTNVSSTFPALTDEDSFLEGTLRRTDLYDLRVSQVWAYHGLVDYLSDAASDSGDYSNVFISADLPSESDNEYSHPQIMEILLPWLNYAGDATSAENIADEYLAAFGETPIRLEFELDVKDRDAVALGTIIKVNTHIIQDKTGARVDTTMLVVKSEEIEPGHRLRVTAQSIP